MRVQKYFCPLSIALMLTVAACGGGSSSTTPPSAAVTTETFSGTVAIGGKDFHSFTVKQTGEVDLTLTAAGPPPTISMGLGVGTMNGSACSLLPGGSTNTQAGTAVQLAGTVSAGTLCVQVYDIGNQTAPITYTVTVAHH